jgi:PAS domain S-box-containing protein
VIVRNDAGDIVFENESYKNKLKAAGFKRTEKADLKDGGVVFSSEKGLAKCYSVSIDVDNENNTIYLFKEITSFVSRKSMTEILDSDDNAEYALKKIIQKNLRMSGLIDVLESGILIEGSSGHLIQVNNSFLKMITSDAMDYALTTEYTAEFYHEILAQLIGSDDYFVQRDKIVSENAGGVYNDEVRFKDGRVYARTYRQLFVGDEPKGGVWKFKDITIRKELESFNIELEANIRALETCESVGIYMEYAGYKFVNKGLEYLLGMDRDSIICEGLEKYLGAIFSDQGTAVEKTLAFGTDETKRYLNIVSDKVTISGNNAKVVTVIDSTENFVLHKDLEKNENRFRSIFEKNQAVMLIFDPSTMEIISANQSAVDFYGKSIEELEGLAICDITTVENMDACMMKLHQIVASQEGGRVPVQQRVANGALRNVELLISPLAEENCNLVFVIVNDVHDRVRYERELENVNANLMEMVGKETEKRRMQEELLMEKSRLAEMGQIVGNVAHQWRQPLSSLNILIDDLQDAYDHNEIDGDYINYTVSKSKEQIDYMCKTIDDFRDFFKPSKQKVAFNVRDSIRQVFSIFLPQINNTGVVLRVSCGCAEHTLVELLEDKIEFCDMRDAKIQGYANQFKQVLLNLLSNSRYAVMKSDVKEIRVINSVTDTKVIVNVEDTGGGIPENIIGNIFDPYFTTKESDGGTGIGLYMSKAIVEGNLGGKLSAANIEGGCRFTIEFDRIP